MSADHVSGRDALPKLPPFNFVSRFERGHRADYIAFVERRFSAKRLPLLAASTRSQPLMFLMIEEWFALFWLVCVLRSALGWKTAGLLFRPIEAARSQSLKLRLKRFLLSILGKLGPVSVLTILPRNLCFAENGLAKDFMYDFQFWDASEAEKALVSHAGSGTPMTALAKSVLTAADGRAVMVALGQQDPAKGVMEMMQWYVDDPKIRESFLFVVAGKLVDSSCALAAEFEALGGMCHDGFVGNDELFELYGVTDIVWAHYRPSYDQSSGIFARALQFDKPVVVREGSLIHRLGRDVGGLVLTKEQVDADHTAHEQALKAHVARSERLGAMSARLEAQAVGALNKALK